MQITIEMSEQEFKAHNDMIELAARQANAIHDSVAGSIGDKANLDYVLQLMFMQFISGAIEGPSIMKVASTLGAGFILVHRTAIIKRAEELKTKAAQN